MSLWQRKQPPKSVISERVVRPPQRVGRQRYKVPPESCPRLARISKTADFILKTNKRNGQRHLRQRSSPQRGWGWVGAGWGEVRQHFICLQQEREIFIWKNKFFFFTFGLFFSYLTMKRFNAMLFTFSLKFLNWNINSVQNRCYWPNSWDQ